LLNAIETKNGEEFSSYYSEFIQQAKEMEKEQIEQAHYAPKYGCFSEQYYNETYGGD
jgi:hypothetical protein